MKWAIPKLPYLLDIRDYSGGQRRALFGNCQRTCRRLGKNGGTGGWNGGSADGNGHRLACGEGKWMERYYINSGDTSAQKFYRNIRGHWAIENRLYRSLDVVFCEDAAQVSRGNRHCNLNILRKTALPLLRAAANPRGTGEETDELPKETVYRHNES